MSRASPSTRCRILRIVASDGGIDYRRSDITSGTVRSNSLARMTRPWSAPLPEPTLYEACHSSRYMTLRSQMTPYRKSPLSIGFLITWRILNKSASGMRYMTNSKSCRFR